jgi:putative tryptophan/tyrosine transport system substrate-binding protein
MNFGFSILDCRLREQKITRGTMKEKIFLYLVATLLLGSVYPARAQQQKKVYRIGYLSSTDAAADSPRAEAFRQGLRELSYVESQNIVIEYRYAEGVADRFPNLAAELVQLKVDVIVVIGTLPAQAAKNATKTIPIVMTYVTDPVGTGLVASLAHPGGNVTGLSNLFQDLGGKQLELLKEAFPKISRVAVLWDPANASNALWLGELKVAAAALRITLQPREAHDPDDLEPAFAAIKRDGANAFVVLLNALVSTYRARIANFAAKSRLPAMYPHSGFTNDGGLMSFGPNPLDSARRAAVYVDKILKGAKPAEFPIEQPKKLEFIINLKTAKQMGLIIPGSVLYRVDRVIE